jgi:hypothetical protein
MSRHHFLPISVAALTTLVSGSPVHAGSDHYYGLPHTAAGQAMLGLDMQGRLRVKGIGSSGEDGVEIELGRMTDFAVQCHPPEAGFWPLGAMLAVRCDLDSPPRGRWVEMRCDGAAAGQTALTIAASGLLYQCVHVELRLDDAVVDRRTFPASGSPTLVVTGALGVDALGNPVTCTASSSATSCAMGAHMQGPALASISGSPAGPVMCDEVMIHLDGLPPGEYAPRRARVTAGDLPGGELVIAGEHLALRDKKRPHSTSTLSGMGGSTTGTIRVAGAAQLGGLANEDICAGCPECCDFSGADALSSISAVTVGNIDGSGANGVIAQCRPWGSPWFVSDLELRTSPIVISNAGEAMHLHAIGTYGGSSSHDLGECTVRAAAGGGTLELLADFTPLGSNQVTVEVYSGGALQGSVVQTGGPGIVLGAITSAGGLPLGWTKCGKQGGGPGTPPCYFMCTSELLIYDGGGVVLVGDDLRVLASGAGGSVTVLESLRLSGSNLAPFTVSSVTNSASAVPAGTVHVHGGIVHASLGQATLGPGPGGDLLIDNLGHSGQDGVSFDLGQSEGASIEFAGGTLNTAQIDRVTFDIYDDQCPMCPLGLVGGLEVEGVTPTESLLRSKRCPDCPPGHVTLIKRTAAPSSFELGDEPVTISTDPGTTLVVRSVAAHAPALDAGYTMVVRCVLAESPPAALDPGVTVSHSVYGTFTDVEEIVVTYCDDAPVFGPIDRACLMLRAVCCDPDDVCVCCDGAAMFGRFHYGLGASRLLAQDCDDASPDVAPVLWVANIGSSGQDGVSIHLPRGGEDEDCDGSADLKAVGAEAVFRATEGAWSVVSGSITGTINDADVQDDNLCSLTWDAGNPGAAHVSYAGDWTGSVTLSLTVRDQNGNVVLGVNGLPPGEPIIDTLTSDPPGSYTGSFTVTLSVLLSRGMPTEQVTLNYQKFEWDHDISMQASGMPPVIGRTIEVVAEPSSGVPIESDLRVAALEVRGGTLTVGGALAVDGVTLRRASPPCPADCASPGDGNVNVTDLLALLAKWGMPGGGSCDTDGSGLVDVTDLLALLAAWGVCP